MRNRFLAGVALAAAMTGSALAADMPLAPVAAPVAYYDWSGAYVGFNIGGAWYDVTHHFTTPGAISMPARNGNGAPGCWARRQR
jgi:opacity protein-like surface antigen